MLATNQNQRGIIMTTKTNKTAIKNATPTATATAKSITTTLFNLQSEAQQWNLNEFKKANDMLYTMLKTCFIETDNVRNLSASEKALFNEQLEERQIKFNKATALETKVIRAVFEIDAVKDKRASKYARVLKIAKADDIQPEVFVNWLIEQNGIDNVGRQDNASKANEKANTLVKAYETAQTSEAKNLNEAKVGDGDYSDISVALLRHVGTEVFPIGFSHNVATINRLLNELYKELDVKKTTEEQRSETENVKKIVKDVRQSQSALKAAA